jgi:glycosyltransferase involved in cell wall biosynthesis
LLSSVELRERMGQKGFEKYQRQFTFESMLRKTLAVYESVGQDI